MNKPTKQHIHFYRNEGAYNWLNSKDISGQYVFSFPGVSIAELKEKGLKSSFLIELDKDYCYEPSSYTALECAYELKNIIDSYWINSDKGEIQKLVDYLESVEEDQGKLRHQYDIDYAKHKVEYWTKELKSLEEEEI